LDNDKYTASNKAFGMDVKLFEYPIDAIPQL